MWHTTNMNTFPKTFLILLVIGVGIIGFGFLHHSSCIEAQAICDTANQEEISSEPVLELAPNYFTYAPESMRTAKQKGKVVLYFWAPWCKSCTSLDIELQDQEKMIPTGVTVLRIKYDQYKDLQKKYNVVTQHTFVQIDSNDEKLSLWVGGDIDNFDQYLK